MPGSPLASNPPWTLSPSHSHSQSSAPSTRPTLPFPSIPPGPNFNPFVHVAPPQTPPTTPEALKLTTTITAPSSRAWEVERHREWVQSLPSRRRRQPSSSSSPALEPDDWEVEIERIFAKTSSKDGSGRRSRTVSADEVKVAIAVRARRGAAAVVWGGEQERVEGGSERERQARGRPSSLFINLDEHDQDLLQPYPTPTRTSSSSGSTTSASTPTSSTSTRRGHQRTTSCPGIEVASSRARQPTEWYTPPTSPSTNGFDSPKMRRRERIDFEEVARERESEASGSEEEGGLGRVRRGAVA